jgi:hypothetical protein
MPVVNPVLPGPSGPIGPVAPCSWTLDMSCCSEWDSYTNTVRDRATAWATQILWALTGRRYGTCEITVRPCGSNCQYYGGWMAYPAVADGVGTVWTPFIRDGVWFNCACAGACDCRARCRAWLPGPVSSVTEVVVDGIVIDPSLYRVDNREYLIGLGDQCWPDCQNMNLESPEVGTFEVTYLRGTPLPLAGQIAAGIMACEFAKACSGGACSLPQNLSTLARQGIEVTMVNPTDLLDIGLTGIAEVDLWIRSVNPDRKTHRPKVYSPDLHYPAMRTS